jgi:hypothetical protein
MTKKIAFGLIGILLVCSSYTILCKGKYEVAGTVMRVRAYCGGAKMPEDRLNELKKPKSYAGKKLFVKKGKFNDLKKKAVLEFVSDSAGHFSFSLQPGVYCIVDEYKNDKSNYEKMLLEYKEPTKNHSAIGPACLKEWFKTPELVFEVKGSVTDSLEITFHDKCPWNTVPCTTYKGALPQ